LNSLLNSLFTRIIKIVLYCICVELLTIKPFYVFKTLFFKFNKKDAPGSPGKPECISRDNNHIEIQWKKPSDDGGAPIKGYYVERKAKGSNKWDRLNKKILKDTSYYDEKVTAKKEYEYRVVAENEGGEGEYSSPSAVIPAKPEKEKPQFDRNTCFDGVKEIRIKAGEPLDVELEIIGTPTPEVTWTKDDKPVNNGVNGIDLKNDEKSVQLHKLRAQRTDTGMYEVKVKNSEGEDKLPVKIIVLDKPGQCEGPLESVETTKNSVTLQWNPPKDDGGSELSGYVIERCEVGTDDWDKCPGVFILPKAKIKNLPEGKAFKFRVAAENIHGVGAPIETKGPIVVKPPYDPPGAPSQPEVVDSNFNFIRLKWNPPTNDGGNPVNGYIIEMKKNENADWVQANNYPCKLPEFTATNVVEGQSYQFRVCAINDAGVGEASKPSKPQKAEPPISKF
jgi:hypothetical protein